MSIESRRHQYGTVFDHWQIGDKLGSGSNGRTAVFHLHHKESSQEESAVKVITLIEEEGRLSEFSDYRRAEYEAELEQRKSHALREVQLMYALKGYTNIVSYEDRVTEHWVEDNSFGCDLLIRMELLQDLRKIIRTGHIFSEAEIIQIGKDICSALILCHGEKDPIIHRDIKPENIFVNSRGTYKLGDFGVSRILDKCQGATATTIVGTEAYLAPEQLRKGYDERVDIYSLGLVLYELCNRNRLPFADNTYATEQSIRLRLAGNTLPAPCNASPELAKIILKACAFKPNGRYKTAQEFLDALSQVGTKDSTKRFRKLITHTDDKKNMGGYETVPARNDLSHSGDYATIPATPDESKTTEAIRKFHELLERAEAGDASAQNGVGCCYYNGEGVKTDYTAAVEWFQKAADQDDSYAEYNLALCYHRGVGVERNYTWAETFYKRAARGGHPSAQNMVAKLCARRNIYEKHDSIIWFYLAAQQGESEAQKRIADLNPEEQVIIADFLFYGKHRMFGSSDQKIDIDYSAAADWYTKAAKKKHGYAAYVLGYCYEKGLGRPKDYAKAFSWYEYAAHRNDLNGMRCLGDCFMRGIGTAPQMNKAVAWYRKASKAGSIISLRRLGDVYRDGTGVSKDLEKAVRYYLKALNKGDEEAYEQFMLMVDRLPEEKRNTFTRKCLVSKPKTTDSDQEEWATEYPRNREKEEGSKKRISVAEGVRNIRESNLHMLQNYKSKRFGRIDDEHYIVDYRRYEGSEMIEGICQILCWIVAVCAIGTGVVMGYFGVSLWISIFSVIALSLLTGFIVSVAIEFFFDRRWDLVLLITAIVAFVIAVITIILMVIVRAIIS